MSNGFSVDVLSSNIKTPMLKMILFLFAWTSLRSIWLANPDQKKLLDTPSSLWSGWNIHWPKDPHKIWLLGQSGTNVITTAPNYRCISREFFSLLLNWKHLYAPGVKNLGLARWRQLFTNESTQVGNLPQLFLSLMQAVDDGAVNWLLLNLETQIYLPQSYGAKMTAIITIRCRSEFRD